MSDLRIIFRLTAAALLAAGLASSPVGAGVKEAEPAFEKGDYATALKQLKKDMRKKKRSLKANVILSKMYLQGLGVQINYSRALKYLTPAAKKNHLWALTEIAKLYARGDGPPQSYVKAKEFLTRAAMRGHGPAQLELGFVHLYGRGVRTDPLEAYAWFNLAAASQQGEARDAAIAKRNEATKSLSEAEVAAAQDLSLQYAEVMIEVKPES